MKHKSFEMFHKKIVMLVKVPLTFYSSQLFILVRPGTWKDTSFVHFCLSNALYETARFSLCTFVSFKIFKAEMMTWCDVFFQ